MKTNAIHPLTGAPALAAGLLASTLAAAGPIDIAQYSTFLYADELGPVSLEYTPLGFYTQNDLSGSGIDVSFSSALNADGLGTATFEFSNVSAGTLTNARLLVFLDAEINEGVNSFVNESGRLESVTGTGAGDNLADSWEIDEPGFVFGDIFDNLLAGSLDNTNATPAGLEDDVSLALGYELGALDVGASWIGTFQTSLLDIGGLSQADADSQLRFWFNGTVDVLPGDPVDLPAPSSLALVLLGMGLAAARPLARPRRR